ncbi:PREDICTED: eisosome protein SEG2-like [Camelina sativa]|uniref:Eisosome protein SEG2-like n=1 Tax=Camelina sativa TaxID=90675 RepID=A0ABM0Y2D3_CAMSA|nr:PREDICTED: eisosome protein SEG2-like [Camelina sativa]
MGCLLGCFGRRKSHRRRQRRRESFQPRLNRISEGSAEDVDVNLRVPIVDEVPKIVKDDHLNFKVASVVEESPKDDHVSVVEVSKVSVIPITDDIFDKVEEKKHSPSPSPSPTRKKVTFDTNVKTYEHIVVDESVEFSEEKKEEVKTSRQARCSSEGSDVTSNSSGSYPSNHRYQNCRESDDEEEDVTDCDESDLDDDDDDEDGGLLDEDYYDDDDSYDDKLHNWDKQVYTEEIADNVMDIEKIGEKTNASARDRSGYVNAVLNPIENLNQWKAVKSKGRTTHTHSRKENAVNASFSLEPQQVDELSSSFSLNRRSRDETKKQRTQEVAVDASLSTWLSTSPTTNSGCSSVETAMSEKKKYSKPVQSHDERPILGALTAAEIKQFSATNSPRKSPSRSPESPIIGTVGGYWNNHSMVTSKNSRSS